MTTKETLLSEIEEAADDHAYSSDSHEYCESSCFKAGALFLADRLIKANADLNQAIYESDKRASERDKAETERDQLKEQLKTAQSEAHVLSVEKNRHEWDKCQTCDQLRARIGNLREALETIREWEYRSTHDTGKALVEQECENALAQDKVNS